MRRFLALVLFLTLTPAAALAQARVVSERPDSVAVTVYPFGLAMVRETRTVMLPAGRVRIDFRAVADRIVPHTVALEGLPSPTLEQNFDYRILSPGALIAAATGEAVTRVRTNPVTGRPVAERARLISSGEGAALEVGGAYEALSCSGGPERIVFDGLPPGFVEVPTLSADTEGGGGAVRLTLSYLVTGIEWQTNYVARVLPGGDRFDLTAWVTITNTGETAFGGAPVQVVAGQLQRVPGADTSVPVRVEPLERHCWSIFTGRSAMDDIIRNLREVGNVASALARGTNAGGYGAEGVNLRNLGSGQTLLTLSGRRIEEEDLGDFKLYNLPEPTTLAPRQTKQLLMFEQPGVQAKTVHRLDLTSSLGRFARRPVSPNVQPRPMQTVFELENLERDGLGLALPRGGVAVFERQGDVPVLLGETSMRDTPEGAPFDLLLSANPLVQAEARVVSDRLLGGRRTVDMEIRLSNASASPVIAQVRERGGASGLRVSQESDGHRFKDGWLEWNLPVSSGNARFLRYTLEWDELS